MGSRVPVFVNSRRNAKRQVRRRKANILSIVIIDDDGHPIRNPVDDSQIRGKLSQNYTKSRIGKEKAEGIPHRLGSFELGLGLLRRAPGSHNTFSRRSILERLYFLALQFVSPILLL